MTRQVLYVAAPLAPSEEEIDAVLNASILPGPYSPLERAVGVKHALRANLDRALRWLSWLRRSFPETTFIAPWIATILSGVDDSDPAAREAGLLDDCAVVERCDGIVLCGPRISSGMRREMEWGLTHPRMDGDRNYWPFDVYDLTPMSSIGFDPTQGQMPHADTGGALRPIPWTEWAEESRVK